MAARGVRRVGNPLALALLLLVNLALTFAYAPLSDASLRTIPSGGSDFDIHNGALLSPILIPRVPGTPGSAKVQEHFVSFFRDQLPLWTVEWHNSTSTTPATGDTLVPFSNLIFRRDPPWAKTGDVSRLTLVAHYDSLYRPEGFIGATDSAAPCAVLMHVARSVDVALSRKWEAEGHGGDELEDVEETGVQIVFLDGEEAWVSWTETDSIYGARALAESWASSPHETNSVYPNPLSSISLFLLLDLLGDANPRVPSYFQNTHWAYQHLSDVEGRMRKLGLLETKPRMQFLPEKDKNANQFTRGFIGDDHVPFLQRGVDILHVIPTPFPSFWHTMDDDAEHLDLPTVRDWGKIVTAFVAEWMELDREMALGLKGREDEGKDEL
ncbi:glutaminyl-peptide cyclotransferase [Coniochaeta ligniaria NRRL 30616]|uniref:Peptide hydrolase n=1 Tax=Coniochaeta ligniaria NRRL 30616 TaxID=1408157 RepID=A0A1J7IFD9_9PEZI|nr:glutaminyl-peptide cyclotransferase [Coniochaeta ligniaria NRRL 30616]